MRSTHLVVALAAACLLGHEASAAVITGNTADATVNASGTVITDSGTYTTIKVGGWDSSECAVYVFALPNLPANTKFDAGASIGFYLSYVYAQAPGKVDLYGLGYRTSPTVLATDFYSGTNDTTDATLLQSALWDASVTTGSKSFTPAALSDYLNAQYLASAADRQSGSTAYVFLRLSSQSNVQWREYRLYGANSWGAEPSITYTTTLVPEPAAGVLLGLGLAAGALRRQRRRTDSVSSSLA